MGVSSSSGEQKAAATPARVSVGATIVVVAGVCAAWLAAGSAGMFARPLQIAMTWLALGVAVVAGCTRRRGQAPSQERGLSPFLFVAGGILVGLACASTADPVAGALSVALILAMIGRCLPGVDGRAVLLASLAAAVLGVFRLACTAIPAVWCLAGGIGRACGWLVGAIVQQPLDVGVTFGGVDFLVLMSVLYVGWLRLTESPRLNRAIIAAAAIAVAHFAYLAALAYSEKLSGLIPVVATSVEGEPRMVLWTWNEALRAALPWNLPLLAVLLQSIVAAAMVRSAKWLPAPEEESAEGRKVRYSRQGGAPQSASTHVAAERLPWIGPAVLAVAIPLVVALPLKFGRSDLSERTILAYDQGLAQWERPSYDKTDPPAARMFGMLPVFVESLGGTFEKSKELSQEELDRADVLLLVHPDEALPADRLERVRAWVRGGGSLLVAGSPQLYRRDAQQAINALLDDTAMELSDAAVKSAAEDWEQCCQPMSHPAAAGVSDWRNRFGLSVGATVASHWPARPLVAGRFAYVADRLAWEKPGSLNALPTGAKYVSGAKLGDVVLAAEQRVGDGRIILLADSAPLTDDGNVAAYEFTGRLFDYLANRGDSPQAVWRQILGLLAAAALVALMAWRLNPWRVSMAAVLLAFAWVGCIALSHWATEVLPDGRRHAINNVAYIDASHLEAYSDRTWDNYGLGNFARTLMRNGYLPLMLPKVSDERLDRAGLLVSIAPARPFSSGERDVVRKFVKDGGRLICMVGAEQAIPGRALLADFEFRVPYSPVGLDDTVREPVPDIREKPYLYALETTGKYYISFYAPWPVEWTGTILPEMLQLKRKLPDEKEEPTSSNDKNKAGKPLRDEYPPFILRRGGGNESGLENQPLVGQGAVIIVGDTFFASNINLQEDELWQNRGFWQWLLGPTAKAFARSSAKSARESGPIELDQPLEPDDEDRP